MTRTIEELQTIAHWVRCKALEMAVRSGSGHVSTACSQCEVLVALYFGGILRYDAKNPKWEERDQFLLSKGQGGLGYYPILCKAGYFPEEELDNFTGVGSTLGVHSESHTPGVEVLTGSLGHGLPIATGKCQAFKNDAKDNLVFCMVGDGELHEGSNWEALMFAGWKRYNNLIVIVDRNRQCTIGRTDGPTTRDGMGLDPLKDKFHAFGFDVREIDGHSFPDILAWFQDVRLRKDAKPLCIIANTLKGKSLSCMEDKRGWHYRVPVGEDLAQSWKDLGVVNPPVQEVSSSQAKHGKGMRDRFFDVLFEYFKKDRNMVLLTADNGAPSMDQFTSLPGQFFQCGIAEQQMIGMAAGLATQGKKVWCYAIAPFVSTRVHEFVKLDCCAMNLPIGLIGVGAGLCYDGMSTTHHNVEDISIMRALPNLHIFSPADGVTAENIAHISAGLQAPHYIRLDRGGLADLSHQSSDWGNGLTVTEFEPEGRDYPTDNDRQITIIATGVMVHQAQQAAVLLTKAGLYVRVIDLFGVWPVNVQGLYKALEGTDFIITLEEHQLAGGLGSIIAEFQTDLFGKHSRDHLRLGIPNKFTFELGGRENLWKHHRLDVDSVVQRIKEWMV